MGKVDPKNKELDLFDKKISEMSMAERLLVFAYADMQNKTRSCGYLWKFIIAEHPQAERDRGEER